MAILWQKIAELEAKIKALEAQLKGTRSVEGSKYELVNLKQMTPSVLKDGTAFRSWREEFERWSGLKVKGLQEILKVIGGRKQWSEELQEEVDKKLKALGYLSDKEEIEEQMKTALEAYTLPSSEERNIHILLEHKIS